MKLTTLIVFSVLLIGAFAQKEYNDNKARYEKNSEVTKEFAIDNNGIEKESGEYDEEENSVPPEVEKEEKYMSRAERRRKWRAGWRRRNFKPNSDLEQPENAEISENNIEDTQAVEGWRCHGRRRPHHHRHHRPHRHRHHHHHHHHHHNSTTTTTTTSTTTPATNLEW
jgi:hypothetical protein